MFLSCVIFNCYVYAKEVISEMEKLIAASHLLRSTPYTLFPDKLPVLQTKYEYDRYKNEIK